MPACKDRAGLLRVQTWYEWVKRTHANTVRQWSGCWPKCNRETFELEIRQEPLDWEVDWLTEVFLVAGSNTVREQREFYTYDSSDLTGDLGGYLGLFLGWSCSSIATNIHKIASVAFSRLDKILLR